MKNAIKILLSSPYTEGDVAQNVRVQNDAFEALINMGFAPFNTLSVPHYHHLIHPRNFDDWTHWCAEWARVCDVVLRLSGESKGADLTVAVAKQFQIPVIDTWESARDFFEKNRPHSLAEDSDRLLYYNSQLAIMEKLMTRDPQESAYLA